jgi:hypothetical protein
LLVCVPNLIKIRRKMVDLRFIEFQDGVGSHFAKWPQTPVLCFLNSACFS